MKRSSTISSPLYKKTSRIISIQNSIDLAEVQITYKSILSKKSMCKVGSSQEVYKYIRRIWNKFNNIDHVESFVVLYLNKGNLVQGWSLVSIGGLGGTVADPKVIFQNALLANAAGIILAHNHPSGNLRPSEADLQVTKRLRQAGEFLDLPVLDHIIISDEGYYSFAD